MSADSAGPALLGPLFQILSLGLSAAAVTNYVQSGGAQVDQLDATLHKRLNASLSTFSIAQLSLLVSPVRLLVRATKRNFRVSAEPSRITLRLGQCAAVTGLRCVLCRCTVLIAPAACCARLGQPCNPLFASHACSSRIQCWC
jgi:hypothetical protein